MTELPPPRAELVAGFRGPEACELAGVSYRQLDYWARTHLVEPSVRAAHGSGTQRLYSRRDVVALRVVRELLDAGISLALIREALPGLLAVTEAGFIPTRSPNVLTFVSVDRIAETIPEPPLIPDTSPAPTLTVVP